MPEPPDDPTTRDLLERATQGDGEAWEAIYRRYHTFLLYLARARVPADARWRIDAEDVLHDCFVAALGDIRGFRYRGEGSLRRWMATIVVNRCRDLLRARRREDRNVPVERDREADLGALPERSGRTPSELLGDAEEERRLVDGISQLDDASQEVVVMRLFERKAFAEIARLLGLGERTARRRYETAMDRLQRVLRPPDYPGGS